MKDNIRIVDILKVYLKYRVSYFVIFFIIFFSNIFFYINSPYYLDFNLNIEFSNNNLIEISREYEERFNDNKVYLKFLTRFNDGVNILENISDHFSRIIMNKYCKVYNFDHLNFNDDVRKAIKTNLIESLRNNKNIKVRYIEIKDSSIFKKQAIVSIKNNKKNIDSSILFDKNFFQKNLNVFFKKQFDKCKNDLIGFLESQNKSFDIYYREINTIFRGKPLFRGQSLHNDSNIKLKLSDKKEVEKILNYYKNKINSAEKIDNKIILNVNLDEKKLINIIKTLPFTFYLFFSILLFFIITGPLSLFIIYKSR